MTVTIVDYKAGNIGSIANICRKAGGDPIVTSDPKDIADAKKLILPGVGHFGEAMARLQNLGLSDALDYAVLQQKVPILGICLGMQLMTLSSEEGNARGLGWFDAETVRFKNLERFSLKVPHMGWNRVSRNQDCTQLINTVDNARFYFVHSYYVKCRDPSDILLTTKHGETFTSAIHKANIWGTQFHPEKSHRFGLQVMKNFVAIS